MSEMWTTLLDILAIEDHSPVMAERRSIRLVQMSDEDRLRIVAIGRLRNGYVPRSLRQIQCSLIEVFAIALRPVVDCGSEGEC